MNSGGARQVAAMRWLNRPESGTAKTVGTSLVIPGPRSGARNPDALWVQDLDASAGLGSGLAYGAPE
jgi:hypothetical protein